MDTSTAPRATPHETEVGAQGGLADAPSWPAIAAWGGGLIQLALGAGAITAVGGGPAIRVAGIVLIVIGAGATRLGSRDARPGTHRRPAAERRRLPGRHPRAPPRPWPSTRPGSACSRSPRHRAADRRRARLRARAAPQSARVSHATTDAAARAWSDSRRRGAGGRARDPALAATEAGQHAVPHGEHAE